MALVGPGVNDQRLSATGPDGSFMFSGLRAGSYQLVVPINATVAAALAAKDVASSVPGTGYEITLGVGEARTQALPFEITHTTVNFSVSLRSGDEMGDALPGASVSLYGANSAMVGSGTTGDDGSVSIKVARAGTSGNMVMAGVSAEGYDVADGMTEVSWDPQSFTTSGSNENDIVNLNVAVNISGRTVERTGQPGSGQPLAGWAIDVMMGDAAVAGAPTALGDDGSVSFTTTVESVPASFTFTAADDQDDALDGGEMYEASGGGYTHDGLSLAGDPVDADAIVVQFTTQTLKVYVHHERDQVYGYTGSSLDGDSRIGGVVDLQIRHRAANGRPRLFTTAQWDSENNTIIGRGSRAGTYTYTNLPANANVFVTADAADGYMLLDPRSLNAYGGEDGLMGGAFGDDGGWGHTVSLCPLMAIDPTGQDHGECGSFAVVETFGVSANVSKMRVRTSGVGFRSSDLPNGSETHQSGVEVALTPVDGKNLGGNSRSRTTASSNDPTQEGDERRELDFGTMAAGTYALGLPAGWRATDQDGGRGQNAFAPLKGDVALTVTPSTAILYGFVRNDRQEGLEGVTVHVNGTETVTDEWGRYITPGFSAMRGQVHVHTSRPGFPDSRPDSTNDATNPSENPPTFAANSVNPYHITLSGANNTFTVTGTVREVNSGAPIAGARIMAGGSNPLNGRMSGRGDWLGQVRTGSDGTYTAVVAARGVGQFVNMTASASGYTFLPAEGIPVHAQAGSSHNVDFTGHSRGKVVGRVVAPDGTPASGITVTAYEGTNSSGTKLSNMTTDATGVFSLGVGAYGSFFIEAEVACVDNPTTDAEIDLCRQEEFSWFDYPSGGQVGTVISAAQPVQFDDIQMRSVQPRITGVKRLTHAAIDVGATPVAVPGDYREFVEVKWEYDREDHQPVEGTTATDLVTGIALAGVAPAPTTPLGIGTLDETGATFTGGVPATAAAAFAGTGTETVNAVSIVQIPSGSPTAYQEFSGEIVLTIDGRTFQNPWTAAGTTESPTASFTVAAVNTTASGVVVSRTATGFSLRWMGTGSPSLVHRVAMMIGDQWLLVPDANVAAVTRITTGTNRGQWETTVTPADPPGSWGNIAGTSTVTVTAAQLAGPLQVLIRTGHGAGVGTATGWMSSPPTSVSGS